MRLVIGPLRSSPAKLVKYSQNSWKRFTLQLLYNSYRLRFKACPTTASRNSPCASAISSAGWDSTIARKRGKSCESLGSSEGDLGVWKTPKTMCSIFLLKLRVAMKQCQRASARGESGVGELLSSRVMNFLMRVMRCFWKLWKMDLRRGAAAVSCCGKESSWYSSVSLLDCSLRAQTASLSSSRWTSTSSLKNWSMASSLPPSLSSPRISHRVGSSIFSTKISLWICMLINDRPDIQLLQSNWDRLGFEVGRSDAGGWLGGQGRGRGKVGRGV